MAHLDIDSSVLRSYMERFYGHGTYKARYWFIGMEFGGGGTLEEIVVRIEAWHSRGGKELEDLGPMGVGAGSRWFRPPYPLQPTWAKLIRVLLSADGQQTGAESIRAYQRDSLGRAGGLDCILELLPLPSPGLARWDFYPVFASRFPDLAYLSSRTAYTNHVAPGRVQHLKRRIQQYAPRAVVFYGTGYRHWWQEIAGVKFGPSAHDNVWTAKNERTAFAIMRHPAARGVERTYFEGVGRMIAHSAIP